MESRVSALSDDDTTGLETLLAIVEDELMAATSDDASSSAGYVPWEVVSRRMAARGRPWDARRCSRVWREVAYGAGASPPAPPSSHASPHVQSRALMRSGGPDPAPGAGECCFGDSEDEAELAMVAEALLSSAIAVSGGCGVQRGDHGGTGDNAPPRRGLRTSDALDPPKEAASLDLRNVVPPTLSTQGAQRPRQR